VAEPQISTYVNVKISYCTPVEEEKGKTVQQNATLQQKLANLIEVLYSDFTKVCIFATFAIMIKQ